jgi:uncharacterized protein YrrD
VRRALEVIGVNVLNVQSGEIIGSVDDLLFDREGSLLGVILEKKHWFTKEPFLPLENITSIGEDLVTVQEDVQTQTNHVPLSGGAMETYRLVGGHKPIKGVPVITSNGKQIGILEDVYFQEEMGTIIGYELSDGFFSDLMEGRRMIKKPDKLLMGKDAFVIHQKEEN